MAGGRLALFALVAVLSHSGSSAAATPVYLLPGQPLAGGEDSIGLAVGDWNGDALPDVVLAQRPEVGHLLLTLSRGPSGFGPLRDLGIGADGVLAGDMNGDALPDLVLREGAGTNRDPARFSVMLAHGDGTFAAPVAGPSSTNGGFNAALGDFNGDGHLGAAFLGTELAVMFGDGQAGLAPPVRYPIGSGGATSFGVADFNGDGISDTALAMWKQPKAGTCAIRLLYGTLGGGFSQPEETTFSHCAQGSALLIARLDDDTRPDLASGPRYRLRTETGFGPERALPQAYPAVAAGEVTGDGRADLIAFGGMTLRVAMSRPDGGWSNYYSYSALPPGADAGSTAVGPAVVADFSGDGLNDLVTLTGTRPLLFRAAHLKPGRCANPVRGGVTEIDGTPYGDSMRAATAHTYMRGRAGDDCLFAASRSSRLFGDAGADELHGSRGGDRLDGGPGNDRIFAAGGGRDTVECGGGRDYAVVDRSDRTAHCERLVYKAR